MTGARGPPLPVVTPKAAAPAPCREYERSRTRKRPTNGSQGASEEQVMQNELNVSIAGDSDGPTIEPLTVKARVPTKRSHFPEPGDIRAIARVAQQFAVPATIPYSLAGERRVLRTFGGGWWDGPVSAEGTKR